MLLQWHVKGPGHSVKSASKHAYTLDPTKCMFSMGAYPEMSSNTSCQGTYGQSSQLAEPLWTDPGLRSGITVHELISTVKKAQTENRSSNVLPKFSQARKEPPSLSLINDVWKTKQIGILFQLLRYTNFSVV